MKITKEMTIQELLQLDNGFIPILMNAGMHCVGCHAASQESLEEAAAVHGIDAEDLVSALNMYYDAKQNA